MTKGCKNFTEIMRMSNIDKKRIQSHKSITIGDFIERFCHKLEIKQVEHIKSLCELCEKRGLNNDNTPPAMASGCIYLYCKSLNIDKSKKDISEVCKISEVTINKCFKKIETDKEIIDYLLTISKS